MEIAREVLAAHMGKLYLSPKQEDSRRFYVVTGAFDLSLVLSEANDPRRIGVAGQDLNLRPSVMRAISPKRQTGVAPHVFNPLEARPLNR